MKFYFLSKNQAALSFACSIFVALWEAAEAILDKHKWLIISIHSDITT